MGKLNIELSSNGSQGEKILTKSPQMEPPSVTGERNTASVLLRAAMGPFMWQLLSRVAAPNPGSRREPMCGCAGNPGPGSLAGLAATAQSLPAWRWGPFRVEWGHKGPQWLRAQPIHPPSSLQRPAAGTAHLPCPSPASCVLSKWWEMKLTAPLEALAGCSGGGVVRPGRRWIGEAGQRGARLGPLLREK